MFCSIRARWLSSAGPKDVHVGKGEKYFRVSLFSHVGNRMKSTSVHVGLGNVLVGTGKIPTSVHVGKLHVRKSNTSMSLPLFLKSLSVVQR